MSCENKITTFFLVGSFILFAVDMNFGGFITTNRIGLCLILFSLLFQNKISNCGKDRKIGKNRTQLPNGIEFLIFGCFLSVAAIVSTIAMETYEASFYRSLSYVFLGYLGLLFARFWSTCSFKQVKVFMSIVGLSAFISSTLLFLWLVFSVKVFKLIDQPWEVRNQINQLPGGLNKFAFGLWILMIFCFWGLKISKFNLKNRLILKYNLVVGSSVLLMFMSRQIVILTACIICFYFIPFTFNKGKIYFRIKPKFIIIIGLAFLFGILIYKTSGDQWYLSKLLSPGGDRDYSYAMRVSATHAAFEAIAKYPLFGTGPGVFINIAKIPVDNSYLLLIAEMGLLGVFCIFIWLLIVFFNLGMKIIKSNLLPENRMIVSSGLVCCVLSLIFNDLLTTTIFWSSTGLMFGFSKNPLFLMD